jgi:hypothetical protein
MDATTKTKLKAGCGLFAVFGAGVVFGAVAFFLLLVRVVPLSEGWRDKESKEFVTKHLARQLDLDAEQIERIRPLVAEALDRRYERRRAYMKEDIAHVEKSLAELHPILTEAQREKAKKVFAQWRKGKERFVAGE